MYTAEEARKKSVNRWLKRVKEKWNLLDFLQLAWFEFWIKLSAEQGKRQIYSFFKLRPNVIKELDEVGDYNVHLRAPKPLKRSWISW